MIVIAFLETDKANRVKLFEETFLAANLSLDIVFKILFLILSNANIDFLDWKFRKRTYITKKAFLTIRRIKLVRKKEFIAATLDSKYEIFVIHIASLSSIPLDIYPFCRP